jgi:putative oxidoreductase
MTKWAPLLLSILRIITGFLFLAHGTQKVFNFPPSDKPMHFELASMMGFSGSLELVGGALILVGLFTRIAAFILSGEMAFAYFMVHAKGGFWPILNHGELAVLYCFVFLYLFAAGPGPISLDAAVRRKA